MSKEAFFIGEPVEFSPGIFVYPPKVRDIITNENFSLYERLLTLSQEEIEDIFVKEKKKLDIFPTPMEFLLSNCYNSPEYQKQCIAAFEFFTRSSVVFMYEKKCILFGSPEQLVDDLKSNKVIRMITEEEFFDFQNLIRLAANQKPVEKPDPNMNPRIKAMKAKARYRDKIKAKKMAKTGPTLSTVLAAICCMNAGLSPLNVGEISYVAMCSILDVYQSKEKYTIDIQSLMHGADSKKISPKYWIRNNET